MNLADAAAGVVVHSLSALPAGAQTIDGAEQWHRGRRRAAPRGDDVSLASCKMAQAVATPGAVPALTAVQVRFRRAPEAPPETLVGEAVLPPLYLHGIVFWDERHKKGAAGAASKWRRPASGWSRTWTA
jgi:hypothetical protein